MKDASDPDAQARDAGAKSERLLQDTYLSGAVGMGAAGPRLSAGTLSAAVDDSGDILVREDSSWKTHAEEEGDPGAQAATAGGLRGLLRRFGASARPPQRTTGSRVSVSTVPQKSRRDRLMEDCGGRALVSESGARTR